MNLGGDLLSIKVTDGPDLTRFFESVPDIKQVVKLGLSDYTLKVPRIEKVLPQIVDGVVQKGLKISDISFTRPTLDQVFLQVAGKQIREGESQAASTLWYLF